MRVIVPPTLLVRMFGVPPMIPMPGIIGTETTFAAYEKRWTVKKIRRDTWTLACGGVDRIRFGTMDEIASDIGHVLETGVFPSCKTSMA